MAPFGLNPDQVTEIISRGDRCQLLLDHEAFKETVDDLTSQNLAGLCAAPPGPRGAEARDHFHALQYALTEFVSALKGYAETGAALRTALLDDEGAEDT